MCLNIVHFDKKGLIFMPDWNERYGSGKYSSDIPHKLLPELIKKIPAGTALDLACGVGRNANFLAENGWQVTAVDNSSDGIEVALHRAEEKGLKVDYQLADLEKGDFQVKPDYYDLICDFYYLQEDLFEPMKAGVKKGGLIISTIHIYGEGEESEGYLLKEGELREYFDDFEILHYYESSLTDEDAGEHYHRTAEIIAKRII